MTDRVRLMQMATIFHIGGTEKQLVELVNGLDGDRFDVQMSCLHKVGAMLEHLKKAKDPVEFKIRRLWGPRTMLQQWRMARHLRAQGTQVLHAQGFYSNVFAIPAARLAGVRAVIGSVRDLGDSRTPLQAWVQRLTCRLADAVIVNAEVVQRQLVSEGWPAKKIRVIHNGVDLSRFESLPSRSAQARAELGLPGEGPLVGVVSRLGPAKGIEVFIDAATKLASRFPRARFLIVGDAHPGEVGARYRATLEKRVAERGMGERILFLGFRLDVAKILSQLDVHALPSLSEALSNSLLESLAAGAPTVATQVGGNPDIVTHGVNGLLIPHADVDALAGGIARLLEQPEEGRRLGEAGRRFVHQRFSVQQMVRNTEDLYLELLERAPRKQATPVEQAPRAQTIPIEGPHAALRPEGSHEPALHP